jgi:DNA-binding beta-propeller fold protein YncE
VQSADFISAGAVSDELVNSRSMVRADGNLYISDWGPYDATWSNPESFVAVVEDITGGDIAYKIPTPSRPEGLAFVGDKILIACQTGSIAVIAVGDDEVEKTVAVAGTPFSFFEFQGSHYLYANDSEKIFLQKLNSATFEVEETLEFPVNNSIYNGNFTINNNGELFVISNQATEDVVVKLSITSGSVVNQDFYSGSNFYGLGYDDNTQTLYIGEHNGWQGNGTVMRINAQGELIDQTAVGRGPGGFYFP